LRSGQPGSSAAPRRAAAPRRTAEQRTADVAELVQVHCARRIAKCPAPTKPAICPSAPVVIHTSPAAMYRDPDHRRPAMNSKEYLTEFHETRSAERRKPALHRRRCSRQSWWERGACRIALNPGAAQEDERLVKLGSDAKSEAQYSRVTSLRHPTWLTEEPGPEPRSPSVDYFFLFAQGRRASTDPRRS
jgi:hypothetical protein